MSGTMTPYIVLQGDYLAKLAFVKGFDADEVWNDPKNDDLRKLRPDPDILAPGDVLYVPEKPKEALPVQQGTENSYAATVPTVTIQLLLVDANGLLSRTHRTRSSGSRRRPRARRTATGTSPSM